MATKAKTKTKTNVNGKRKRQKQLTLAGIPKGLTLDGNPVLGFRVPRGLLEEFDAKHGRKQGTAMLLDFMARSVRK